MGKPYAAVRCADGRTEHFPLTESELVLGRSTKAGISMPGEVGLELQHLLLVPRGAEGCWVSVAEHGDAVELDGEVFRAGLVSWGSELRVAGLRIRLLERTEIPRLRHRRALLLGAAALIAAGSWLLLSDGSRSRADTEAKWRHPSLFSEQRLCPDPQDAVERAGNLEREASSHSVRYDYDPQDGVMAVLRIEQAAACHSVAGDAAEAARLAAASAKLRHRIEADYAAVRLRLSDAIERSRGSDIVRAARHLRRLTAHLQGNDYVQWLEDIETQAAASL